MIIPTCRELIEFLDDYVAGRLPLARRLAFEAHLALCRECRAYLASYRQTMALARDAEEGGETGAMPPMPEDMVRAILDSLGQGPGMKG